jgi:hypothetical protein
MSKQEYDQKAVNIINDDSFVRTPNSPAEQYHRAVRTSLTNDSSVINLNPQQPSLRAITELHKPNNPIRPIIN